MRGIRSDADELGGCLLLGSGLRRWYWGSDLFLEGSRQSRQFLITRETESLILTQ